MGGPAGTIKTWTGIWRTLPLPDRMEAAGAFWANTRKGEAGWQFAVDFLEDKLRARPVFVEKQLPLPRKVQLLAQQTHAPDILLGSLLGHLLLLRRPHLLRRFVDALGLP